MDAFDDLATIGSGAVAVAVEPPKRRGRPPKDTTDDIPKRRGRPRKTPAPVAPAVPADVPEVAAPADVLTEVAEPAMPTASVSIDDLVAQIPVGFTPIRTDTGQYAHNTSEIAVKCQAGHPHKYPVSDLAALKCPTCAYKCKFAQEVRVAAESIIGCAFILNSTPVYPSAVEWINPALRFIISCAPIRGRNEAVVVGTGATQRHVARIFKTTSLRIRSAVIALSTGPSLGWPEHIRKRVTVEKKPTRVLQFDPTKTAGGGGETVVWPPPLMFQEDLAQTHADILGIDVSAITTCREHLCIEDN